MKKEKSVLQDFSLGQQITIASVLKRMTKYSTPDEYGRSKRLKVWENIPLEKPNTAIVVGVRTLSNGYTDWDREIGNIYSPANYFKALLVVSTLNSAPYFVQFPTIAQND